MFLRCRSKRRVPFEVSSSSVTWQTFMQYSIWLKPAKYSWESLNRSRWESCLPQLWEPDDRLSFSRGTFPGVAFPPREVTQATAAVQFGDRHRTTRILEETRFLDKRSFRAESWNWVELQCVKSKVDHELQRGDENGQNLFLNGEWKLEWHWRREERENTKNRTRMA